ncbi:IS3 family transposase, partial [Nitrosomonas sp. Nm33]|uniref:IS3 family transposase n=1 Tax=Nitrosomonas sp. Nm33 TaxID=133724 RepID=UPI0035255311
SEVSRSLEINGNMLRRWIREYQADDNEQAFRGNGKLTAEEKEIRQLRAQIRQLKLERQILKEAAVFFGERNEVKYSFITQRKKTYPVGLMCQLMGVSRSAYYNHVRRAVNQEKEARHEEMLEAVRNITRASHHTYGSRRIRKAVNAPGYPVGRWKARSLMREAGVQVKYRKKYKVTTHSNHKQPVFENKLNRQFDVANPDQVYVGDITYIWTREGWLYLAVVIDLFSRKVVGWSMSSRMKARLVCDALRMATWQRQPQEGLIVHSDRGSQYASREYQRLLKIHGFLGSMSRAGDCFDNAVAESFFGSLKQERVQWRNYQTRYAAQQDVLQYISMFYNSHRLHSYLGYRSPNQYEIETEKLEKVA